MLAKISIDDDNNIQLKKLPPNIKVMDVGIKAIQIPIKDP